MNTPKDPTGGCCPPPPCSALSDRDKAIWRAALTLAHNMCVQDSDRINADDGSLEVVHALSDEAKRIKGWLEPTDDQLLEMFIEAGVPNSSLTNAESVSSNERSM